MVVVVVVVVVVVHRSLAGGLGPHNGQFYRERVVIEPNAAAPRPPRAPENIELKSCLQQHAHTQLASNLCTDAQIASLQDPSKTR